MVHTDVKLNISPEIIRQLGLEKESLWSAAHDDGSNNRIDGEDILESASYGTVFGIISAVFQGARKAFRNRGKTKEDFVLEKEAANINKTCGAFELMLRDYLQAAMEGRIDDDDLDDLIDMLKEMESYDRAGKLKNTGKKELTEICKSITEYTAAMAKTRPEQPIEAPAADQFRQIREQLIRQKEQIGRIKSK